MLRLLQQLHQPQQHRLLQQCIPGRQWRLQGQATDSNTAAQQWCCISGECTDLLKACITSSLLFLAAVPNHAQAPLYAL
jgi:hypothetical protein